MLDNWQDILSKALSYTGNYSSGLILVLFVICLIGEAIGLSVPYLLETIWIMAGYNFSHGLLSFWQLCVLMLVAQLGRQGGMLALYSVSRTGSALLARYLKRFKWEDIGETITFKGGRKINLLSPFSVAMGRLLWVRIPLTLILGAKRKLRVLSLGTAISTQIYDMVFIVAGAIFGTTTKLQPVTITLFSVAALTVIWAITFGVRRLIRLIRKNRTEKTSGVS